MGTNGPGLEMQLQTHANRIIREVSLKGPLKKDVQEERGLAIY